MVKRRRRKKRRSAGSVTALRSGRLLCGAFRQPPWSTFCSRFYTPVSFAEMMESAGLAASEFVGDCDPDDAFQGAAAPEIRRLFPSLRPLAPQASMLRDLDVTENLALAG